MKAAPETSASPPEPPAQDPAARPLGWDVIVEVADGLYGQRDAAAPIGLPLQTFTLFDDESTIGRAGTEVRVRIPVAHDHGVSRRQAVLVRRPDGSLIPRPRLDQWHAGQRRRGHAGRRRAHRRRRPDRDRGMDAHHHPGGLTRLASPAGPC